MNTKNARLAIGVSSAAACAAILAGCSASAPLAVENTTTTHRSVEADAVGDGGNGCYPVNSTNDHGSGWNCSYSGSPSTFTVPAGINITAMTISMSGGQGGNSDPASGGYGAAITATIPVIGSQTVTVNLGGGAGDNTPGLGAVASANGGTPGCSDGGAGGAASTLEVDGITVAVAGGGGGGGAQGIFPDIDAGGVGGTPPTNSGNGTGGSGPGSGDHGAGGAGGSSLTPGDHGSNGDHGGGCAGGGGGGWSGGDAGGRGSWGGGGGAGGGAGGDYFSSSAINTSAQPADVGGDGTLTLLFNN